MAAKAYQRTYTHLQAITKATVSLDARGVANDELATVNGKLAQIVKTKGDLVTLQVFSGTEGIPTDAEVSFHGAPPTLVVGDQLAGRRLHPSAGAFGPGIPARHQPDRLLAAGGLPPGQRRVLPRHQDDLPDQRAGVKDPQAAAQHRPVPQVIPKFIKAHPGGRACRQNHGRSCLFHLSVLVCPAYAKARYIL